MGILHIAGASSAAIMALSILAGTAAAKPAEASSPTVVALQSHPSQPEWAKVCNGAEADGNRTCYVSRDFINSDGDPVLAVAWYEIGGSKVRRAVRVLLPLGLTLDSGIRIAVDDTAPISGTYTSCSSMGCFAEAAIDERTFQKIGKANKIAVGAKTMTKSELVFVFPASGIGRAFEGQAFDPDVLADRQDNLKREIHQP